MDRFLETLPVMFQAWTSSLSAQNVARCRRLSALEADLPRTKLDGLLLVVNDSCNRC